MPFLRRGSFHAVAREPLAERLRKRWEALPLSKKQQGLFLVAEIALVLLLVMQWALFGPVLDEILLEHSESELHMLEMTYEEKVHFMGVQAELLAERSEVDHETLHEVIDTLHLEFATLLGAEGEVLASGNNPNASAAAEPPLTPACNGGNTSVVTGALELAAFEAEGAPIWRERTSDFNPVAADHMVDLERAGLVRWVVAPRAGCDGFVVLGDVVDGKVPIVEDTVASFGSGYAGVWYEGASRSSYMAFEQDSYASMLAGVQLRNAPDPPRAAGAIAHASETILDAAYTMAVSHTVDDVVLVRGTDHVDRDHKQRDLAWTVIALCVALVTVDSLAQYHLVRAFVAPLEKLGRKLAAADGMRSRGGPRVTPEDLAKVPSQKMFVRRAAASQLLIGVAIIIVAVRSVGLVHDMQAEMVDSETQTMTHFFEEKLADMSFVAQHLADAELTRGVLAAWDGAACTVTNASAVELKHELKALAKPHKVEMAVLVDRNADVVVSSTGVDPDDDEYLRCDRFDPSGVASSVLAGTPKEIHASAAMLLDEYRRVFPDLDAEDYFEHYGALHSDLHPEVILDDLLVRWVAVPVFTQATSDAADANCELEASADGVLLLGEVVNGKLSIPGDTMDVFGTGYAGIYLFDAAIDEWVLVTSLLNGEAVDVPLGDTALLERARLSAHHEAVDHAVTIRGSEYSVKVQAAPADVWIDAYGANSVAGVEPVAFLVRGTSVDPSDAVQTAEIVLIAVSIVGYVVVVLLRLALAYQSYLPAKRLISSMRRAGLFKTGSDASATSDGSSSSLSSSSSSSSSASDDDWDGNGDGDGEHGHHHRRHHRLVRLVVRRLKKLAPANWVVNLLLLSCVAAMAAVLPVASHLDSSGFEDVVELTSLTHYASAYMGEVQIEREMAGLVVDSGYDDDLVAELVEQRHATDAHSLEFLHALTASADGGFTDSFDADVKAVRKDVYAMRTWRAMVDTEQFDSAAESDAFPTLMNEEIVHMLSAVVYVPEDADSAMLAYVTLTALAMSEDMSLETEHLRAALHDGAFESHAAFLHFLETYDKRLVDDMTLQGTVHGTAYADWREDGLAGPELERVEHWAHEAAYEYPSSFPVEDGAWPTERDFVTNATVVQHMYVALELRYNHELKHVAAHNLHETEDAHAAIVAETLVSLAATVLVLLSVAFATKEGVLRAYASARSRRRRRGEHQAKRAARATAEGPDSKAGGESARKQLKRRMKEIEGGSSWWRRWLRRARRFRNEHVGAIFLLLAALALALSCAVWGYEVGVLLERTHAIDELREVEALAAQAAEFMHVAQAERVDAVRLVSGGEPGDDDDVRAATDAQLAAFLGELDAQRSAHDAHINALIVGVADALAGMEDWRADIDGGVYDGEGEAAAAFLSDALLAVGGLLQAMGQLAIDADQFRLLAGRANVAMAKEMAAQEDALMIEELAAGHFESRHNFAAVLGLVYEREAFVAQFERTVPGYAAVDLGLIGDWEAHIAEYPAELNFTSVDAWKGNFSVVLDGLLDLEHEVDRDLMAAIDRAEDDAWDEFVNIAVPHLWVTACMMVVTTVFFVAIFPLSDNQQRLVFLLTRGRCGRNTRTVHATTMSTIEENSKSIASPAPTAPPGRTPPTARSPLAPASAPTAVVAHSAPAPAPAPVPLTATVAPERQSPLILESMSPASVSGRQLEPLDHPALSGGRQLDP